MDKIKITIAGVEYNIKESFRVLMMFEELSQKLVSQINGSIVDSLQYFYCFLKANNPDTFTYSFEAFIDVIELEPTAVKTFMDFVIALASAKPTAVTPQKKSTRK